VERRALSKQGADSRYKVAPVQSTYGYSSLMLGITGVGTSGPQAIRTAELVGAALNGELENLQASRGVAPRYRIKSELIDAPDTASQKVSGKLRTLIGVLVLGVILLFVVISAAEGLATLRAEWTKREPREEPDIEGPLQGAAANNSTTNNSGRHKLSRRARRAASKA
jgi:hypothetical protein